MSDYLPSLKETIKAGKIGQAKTLLEKAVLRPIPEKEEILQILALAPDNSAFELLLFLTTPQHRDPDIYDRLIQLIMDRAHLNYKFVLILFENADRKTINHSVPLVKHVLSNETDKDLLNQIIRSVGKTRIETLSEDIAEFIFYDDVGLKTEAVKALERIGTPFACEKLVQASKTEKCDQNILDTIQVLRAKEAAQKSPAPSVRKKISKEDYETDLKNLSSNDVHKRFSAFIDLSEKGSTVSSLLLKQLRTNDHDLMINILRLISRTIPVGSVNDIFSILDQKTIDSTVKFAVYSALEAFPELESAASVVKGLSEPAMYVRLAAIKTLDKNPSDFVIAEIKNKIESGTKKGELLAEAILDARAKHIIEALMISDTFSYISSNYLSRMAPIPVLDTFISILEKRNLKSTAKKYIALRNEKASQDRAHFIVISSSEVILTTYRKLIYACGFSSFTFQHSQDAFEAIVSQKPCAIICDLFLNDMTAMDLAREVRGIYTKDAVPFIVSTLQKTLDQDQLKKELDTAGVNVLCDFPAKTSQIKSWANRMK